MLLFQAEAPKMLYFCYNFLAEIIISTYADAYNEFGQILFLLYRKVMQHDQ